MLTSQSSTMRQSVTICLGIFIMLSSCEKVEIQGVVEDPVFTATLPIAEEVLEVVAGDDLYYMYASHFNLKDEIIYKGLFGKDESCEANCAQNFSIEFHQKIDAVGDLQEGLYAYYSIPKDGYKHSFSVIDNASTPIDIDDVTWRIGSHQQHGESITIDANNDQQQSEDIRLIYDGEDAFKIIFARKIIPTTVSCDFNVNIKPSGTTGLIEVETESPFAFVSWSTGHVGTTITIDPTIKVYTARVFSGDGCSTDLTVHVKNPQITEQFSLGLNQVSVGFTTPDNANNAVAINYTNEDGVFYTTNILGQILPFRFELVSIEEYDTNELGNPTWKMTAKFDCILFGEDESAIRINGGEATFAVSYDK